MTIHKWGLETCVYKYLQNKDYQFFKFTGFTGNCPFTNLFDYVGTTPYDTSLLFINN